MTSIDTPYYDFRIDGIVRDGRDPGSVIDGYYGILWEPKAVSWVRWGAWTPLDISSLTVAGHSFHTMVDGMAARVVIKWTTDGKPFLQTSADTLTMNNLSKLDWSRLISIAPPPQFLFNTASYRAFLQRVRDRQRLALARRGPLAGLGK